MADEDIREGEPRRRRKSARNDDDEAPKSKGGGGGSMFLMILGGVGLLFVTVCCCAPGGGIGYWWWSTTKTAEERQAKIENEAGIVVTAEEMSIHYTENQIGADAKYKDKIVTVTGRVRDIIGDDVRLRPGVPPGKIVLGGVYCTFGDKYKTQVTNLKINDPITIRGYCTGQGFAETGKLIYCKKIN